MPANHIQLRLRGRMKLIFIHGSGGCRESWQHQTAYFKNSEAINLPGHPDGELCASIKEYTKWLKTYIHDNGYTDVVITGHSMGGGVALQYALDYPEDLLGIILIGSGARLRVHPRILEALDASVADSSNQVNLNANMYDLIDPQLRAVIEKRTAENTSTAFLNDLKACDAFDVMAALPTIDLPLLGIVGEKDIMTPPKYTHFMVDSIVNAKSVVIKGGTHFVFAEKPDDVNKAIGDFIKAL